MEEVEDLVVTPFRDIVDKATVAIKNAGDGHPDMLTAARALSKEGARGLNHIEPLCRKYINDYGSSFVVSLKDNDAIADHRTELMELLWDFDEFIVPADFQADKFASLQNASKRAAMKIADILKRMKLEAPVSDTASSRGSVVQLPTPTSPPSHSIGLVAPGILAAQSPVMSQRGSATNSASDVHDATAQLSSLAQVHSGSDPRDGRLPPRPPSANPWDWQARPASDTPSYEDVDYNRIAVETESPILPNAPLGHKPSSDQLIRPPAVTESPTTGGSYVVVDQQHVRRQDDTYIGHGSMGSDRSTGQYYQVQQQHQQQPLYYSPHPRSRQNTGLSSTSIPENQVPMQHGSVPYFHSPTTAHSPIHHPRSPPLRVPPTPPEPIPTSPRAESVRKSVYSDTGSPRRSPKPSELLPGFVQSQAPEVVQQVTQNTDPQGSDPTTDYGPIPVEEESVKKAIVPTKQQMEECRIGADSSFHTANGFCEGATEVIRGGIGVKKIKKPSMVSVGVVARCLHCPYELDFARIEADVNRENEGNFILSGINYRLRFLQKSHILAKRFDDILYGCVFCIQQGYTMHRSDATVFFSPKALMEHLARHPRPLPEVPGLTVIDGDKVPTEFLNDYDLHFKNPPRPHPVIERIDEISSMPSGITKDQSRKMYGQRILFDKSPALQVAKNARVIGLRWPPQHNGEWCFGWHEGVYASIPTDLLRLEPPPPNEIRYDRTSLVTAKARWKFPVKDKEKNDWLRFEKGETISNLAWVYQEHWCWTGTNEKKKTGIFPQAFIDTNTIKEPAVGSRARTASLKEEQARSSSNSIISKLSMRKNTSASVGSN